MALEIERKFLIELVPDWLADKPSEEIGQGYVTASGDSVQVRIRRKGSEAILGVKRGHGLSREETEVSLDPGQGDALWALTGGRRVSKRRHLVEHGGMTIEVDVFAGRLDGLVVAEVEFESEEASERFTPPDWFGREVTGEGAYENERLAEDGIPGARG